MKIPPFLLSALAGGLLAFSGLFPDDIRAAELEASDGAAADYFGSSASLSGNTALVGASGDDAFSGSAYVFRGLDTATGTITQNVKLLASDGEAFDGFGISSSLSGNTALVGATGDADYSGSAYVFRGLDTATGTITQNVKLLASDRAVSDNFGSSVSLSGSIGLVGAFYGTGNDNHSGTAYVFRGLDAATGTINESAKLVSTDGVTDDAFGASVSLSASTGLVGAYSGEVITTNSGSAYVFRDLDTATGTISQNAELFAMDGASGDYFGWSVSLAGSVGLVGAIYGDGMDNDSGTAYVFRDLDTATGNTYEAAKLIASDGAAYDNFGYSVSVSGITGLVGASGDADRGTDSGSAYLFRGLEEATDTVTQSLKLTASDGATNDRFGYSVSLDGDNFVITAPGANGAIGKAYTGSVSSLTTLDAGNASRVIDGISFASWEDWVIGQARSSNLVNLTDGDTANVTAAGKAVYIGQTAWSNDNALIIDGTLTTTTVNVGAVGNSGNALIVNGLLRATENVVVASGSTVGGTGTIEAPVNVQGGGIVAPGRSPGSLTINNNLNLANNARFRFELGTVSDQVAVTGVLDGTAVGTAGTVQFEFVDSGGFAGGTYTLLTFASLSNLVVANFTGNSLLGWRPVFDLRGTKLLVTFQMNNNNVIDNAIDPTEPFQDIPINGEWTTSDAANFVGGLIFNTTSTVASLAITGSLTNLSGNVTVAQGVATISGDPFQVDGNLTKKGPGTLVTTGTVRVSGDLEIAAGTYRINGVTLVGDETHIAPGATLGGDGFLSSPQVLVDGTLSPGNSPGTLTIAGNLTLNRGGTTQLEVESLSVFDQIGVSGLATLGGTLNVVPYNGYDFEFGQQFNFLSAGEVTGTFDSVTIPEGFRGRILVNGGSVTLVAAPASYTQVAQNQNQFNVAAALDGFIPATSGDRLTVSTALDLLSEGQYPAAFDQISPAFYQTLTSTTIEQYNAQGQFLQQRFSSAALGRQAGFNQYGTQAPVLNEKSGGKAVANAKDIVEATPDNKWGIWTLGNGIFANSSLASVSNYRSQSGGFLVGGDYRLGDALVAGVFGGYQGTVSRYDNGGRTTINAARFGAYASYNPGSGFYANTVVGGGYSAYDVKRPIQFGSVNRAANSAPGGAEFVSQLSSGYDWKAGGFTFGPVGGLQYTYAGVGGFGENGAESLNLRVGQQNANSLRSTLGARVAYTWVVNDKVAIIPEARLSWQHEFLMNPTGMSAALDGGNGPGFGYTSTAPARDAVFAGAGVTLQVGDRWNANVYYNADFGRSDFTSQMISGGLGVSF